MEYLEFVYSVKGNISRMFDVCTVFYRIDKQDRSFTKLFMDYKKTYEELNTPLPFSPDVKVHQDQREKMAVMGFLAALPSKYDSIKAQTRFKCIFLGYSRVQKGYRCYCASLRRYLVSTNVTFLENAFFSQDPIHTS